MLIDAAIIFLVIFTTGIILMGLIFEVLPEARKHTAMDEWEERQLNLERRVWEAQERRRRGV